MTFLIFLFRAALSTAAIYRKTAEAKLYTFCWKSTENWSILTWSSSAIFHSVCLQCSMLSVYLKCVSRFFQWIRISNKEFVSNFALQMVFRVGNRWKCYRRHVRWIDFMKNKCIWVVQCIQKRPRCVRRYASLWSAINVFNWS